MSTSNSSKQIMQWNEKGDAMALIVVVVVQILFFACDADVTPQNLGGVNRSRFQMRQPVVVQDDRLVKSKKKGHNNSNQSQIGHAATTGRRDLSTSLDEAS
jgi:hypothetical protein